MNPFDQPGVEEGKVYTREALLLQKSEEVLHKNAAEDDNNSPVHRLRRQTD